MKINNSLDIARWEKTKCSCNHDDIEQCHPIHNCTHCKSQEAWDSVPKENFTVIDVNEKKERVTRVVDEITLVRGHDLQDVIGWTF